MRRPCDLATLTVGSVFGPGWDDTAFEGESASERRIRASNRQLLSELLDEADASGLKVTWIEQRKGWRCVVTSTRSERLPPHHAIGVTPLAALAEAMRFFRAIGIVR